MRDLNHFLFYTSDINSENIVLDKDESSHATKVLRIKEGDLFQVTKGDGIIRICKLYGYNDGQVNATIVDTQSIPKIPVNLHMYIGIPDKDAFENAITDLTAMGVTSITPLISDFCQKSWWEHKWEKHAERMQCKIISAMKQSLYPYMPEISSPKKIDSVEENGRQTFYADYDGTSMSKFNQDLQSDVNCIIGPPGGFSQNEISLFKEKGYVPIKIAFSRLRTELASIVFCSQILDMKLP